MNRQSDRPVNRMNIKSSPNVVDLLRDFLKLESASGLFLIAATVIALVMANIPLAATAYDWFLSLYLTSQFLYRN